MTHATVLIFGESGCSLTLNDILAAQKGVTHLAQQIYTPPTRSQLMKDARKLFDNPDKWLRTRNEYLGGRTPEDLIESGEEGREQVRNLLEAIKLGMPT